MALRVFTRSHGWKGLMNGTNLMCLGIAGMHFTAMSALTLTFDPTIASPQSASMPPQWLAITVAAVMAMIVVLGLVAAVIDHHLASRAVHEAERLRAHVVELEATKRELQATAENLTKALDAAAAASQAKSQFLATMSHELRTPLNAIIGFSELLKSELFGPIGDARYKGYVNDVHRSGKHLLALVNDVLDFSKIDAGHLTLQEDQIDIGETLSTIPAHDRGPGGQYRRRPWSRRSRTTFRSCARTNVGCARSCSTCCRTPSSSRSAAAASA